MAGSKAVSVLIVLNLIFFICVTSDNVPCPSIPKRPAAMCPKDSLKFGACGNWLGLVTEVIGAKPSSQCCTVLKGLADLEAALCLCTEIKANVLGVIKLQPPIALSLVINGCGKKVPEGFVCP